MKDILNIQDVDKIEKLENEYDLQKASLLERKLRLMISENPELKFTPVEFEFINSNTPYEGNVLKPTLISEFNRCTFVNKNFQERSTVDTNLSFCQNSQQPKAFVDSLVIMEIKTEGKSVYSPLINALEKRRIKQSNISKYCIGRTIIEPQLKINSFKEKLRNIEKISHSKIL